MNERQFISFDLVSIPSGPSGRKERGFFLFSDLLVISSIKRRTGTMRKPTSYDLATQLSLECLCLIGCTFSDVQWHWHLRWIRTNTNFWRKYQLTIWRLWKVKNLQYCPQMSFFYLFFHLLLTAKDENVEKARKEIDNLTKDLIKLGQMMDIASSLRYKLHTGRFFSSTNH